MFFYKIKVLMLTKSLELAAEMHDRIQDQIDDAHNKIAHKNIQSARKRLKIPANVTARTKPSNCSDFDDELYWSNFTDQEDVQKRKWYSKVKLCNEFQGCILCEYCGRNHAVTIWPESAGVWVCGTCLTDAMLEDES